MVIICNDCGQEFRDKYNLKSHKDRKIPCTMVINTRCFICLTEFSSVSALNRHMNKQNRCQQVNINNSHNTNTNHSHNVTNNKIYINFINHGDKEYKQQMMHQIIDQFKITNCILLKLILSGDHDETDNLNNIDDFTNLINIICFDIATPDNWRFIYDNMSRILKIKVNDDIINFDDNFLEFVYTLYKQVINCEFVNRMDTKLIEFYKKFISDYESHIYDGLDINVFLNQCHETLFDHYIRLVTDIDLNIKGKTKLRPAVIGYKMNIFGEEDLDIQLNEQKQSIKSIKDIFNNGYNYDSLSDFQYKRLNCSFDDLLIYDIFIKLFVMIYVDNKSNRTIKYHNKSFRVFQQNKTSKKWVNTNSYYLVESVFKKINEFVIKNEIVLPTQLDNEFKIKRISKDDSDSDELESDYEIDSNHIRKYVRMIQYILLDDNFRDITNYLIK